MESFHAKRKRIAVSAQNSSKDNLNFMRWWNTTRRSISNFDLITLGNIVFLLELNDLRYWVSILQHINSQWHIGLR